MARDEMRLRLHLRRVRVLEVLVDTPFELKVLVADTRSVLRCPACGQRMTKVHDTRDVVVRDVDFGGRPTTLVWRRRRFVCEGCGDRHLEDHPEIAGNLTARLARFLERDAKCMSIREVCRRTGFSWHFVMGLVRAAAARALTHRRRLRCRVLLIDETSLRRRHRYVTMVSDGESGALLGMTRGRDTLALQRLLASFGPRWRRGVEVVVSDGSEAYRAAIQWALPRATHVIDRFHVVRWLAACQVEVRRRLQRLGPKGTRPAYDPDVFRSRYLQLTRFDHLSPEEAVELGKILQANPELERAWRLAQHLHGFYEAGNLEGAQQALSAFADTYAQASLPEFYKTVNAILEWSAEIFAFHATERATNGRQEGLNNKIGVLKRVAYGFVNERNLAARSLLLCPGVYT
jgi:transposase